MSRIYTCLCPVYSRWTLRKELDSSYHTLAALAPLRQLRQACRIANLERIEGKRTNLKQLRQSLALWEAECWKRGTRDG